MQISSATRAISSVVLVTVFLFAPIGNLLEVHQVVLPTVPAAEAVAPIANNISGTVHLFLTASTSSTIAPGMTVNLNLKNSGALQATAVTDAEGKFVLAAPLSVDYVLSIVPAIGYGVPIGSPLSFELNNLAGTLVIDGFLVEKLPSLFLYGGSTIFLPLGATFEDPGVELRKTDGTVVHGYGIGSSGTVNEKVSGVYTLTYHIDPKATGGFPIADAVRTVIVGKIAKTPTNDPNKVSSPSPDNNTACVLLRSYLSKDSANNKLETLKLQTFLFIYEGLTNVRATGVYDEATERAVRIFQDRHFPEVLSLWGIDGNTGNVYMTTQKKINEIYCGHEFPLTFSQLKEIALYRVSVLGQKGASPVVPTAPAVVSTEEAASTGTMAAWWNRAKQGLLAITPAFHSKKEVGDISASSSVAANLDGSNPLTGVKGGNIATPLNSFRSFLNMSTLAVIVAFLLGILAFGMSIYLYRRTRDEVEVSATGDPVIDIPATPKK